MTYQELKESYVLRAEHVQGAHKRLHFGCPECTRLAQPKPTEPDEYISQERLKSWDRICGRMDDLQTEIENIKDELSKIIELD